MKIETASLVGRWTLVAHADIKGEIRFIDDEPDPDGVSDWLNGTAGELDPALAPTSGVTLEITPNGHFAEIVTGKPAGEWFDVEGVLANGIVPMNGLLVCSDDCAYLQPEGVPTWSKHALNRYGQALLRYDDGDTKISDGLRLHGTRLLRTMNVVTDELYLNRGLFAYERVA